MDTYYENKKKQGLIFTLQNVDPNAPMTALDGTHECRLVFDDEGPSYWSHLSHRYRTYEEQQEFIKLGCIDQKLPPMSVVRAAKESGATRPASGFRASSDDVIVCRSRRGGWHYGV